MIPESISSDKIHGAVGSEAELEFEFMGATGEPCNCIINHNPKKITKSSYIPSHDQMVKHKWHLKHEFVPNYKDVLTLSIFHEEKLIDEIPALIC